MTVTPVGDIYYKQDYANFIRPWLQGSSSTEVRYTYDEINELEAVVNLETGATWIGVEKFADRGIYFYQGKEYRTVIDIATWRENFYSEDFTP